MNVDKYDKLTHAYKKTKRRQQVENVDREGDVPDVGEYSDQLAKGIDMMLCDRAALLTHSGADTDCDQRSDVVEYKNETDEHLHSDTDAMSPNHAKDRERDEEDLQHHSDGDAENIAVHHEDDDVESEDDEGALQDNGEGALAVEDDEEPSSPVMDGELALYNN